MKILDVLKTIKGYKAGGRVSPDIFGTPIKMKESPYFMVCGGKFPDGGVINTQQLSKSSMNNIHRPLINDITGYANGGRVRPNPQRDYRVITRRLSIDPKPDLRLTLMEDGGKFEQDKSYNCGPFATSYLLNKKGLTLSPKVLEKIQGSTSKDGTSPEQIKSSIKNFAGGGYEKNNASIQELSQNTPAMVDYQYNGDGHYSVVNKVDNKGVHVFNVAKGKTDIIPTDKFQQKWHDTRTNGSPNNNWFLSLNKKNFERGGVFGSLQETGLKTLWNKNPRFGDGGTVGATRVESSTGKRFPRTQLSTSITPRFAAAKSKIEDYAEPIISKLTELQDKNWQEASFYPTDYATSFDSIPIKEPLENNKPKYGFAHNTKVSKGNIDYISDVAASGDYSLENMYKLHQLAFGENQYGNAKYKGIPTDASYMLSQQSFNYGNHAIPKLDSNIYINPKTTIKDLNTKVSSKYKNDLNWVAKQYAKQYNPNNTALTNLANDFSERTKGWTNIEALNKNAKDTFGFGVEGELKRAKAIIDYNPKLKSYIYQSYQKALAKQKKNLSSDVNKKEKFYYGGPVVINKSEKQFYNKPMQPYI